jgi:hypothetical protein
MNTDSQNQTQEVKNMADLVKNFKTVAKELLKSDEDFEKLATEFNLISASFTNMVNERTGYIKTLEERLSNISAIASK